MKFWSRMLVLILLSLNLLSAQSELSEKLSRKISANFQNTAITDVLRLLSSQNSFNLVVGEGVEGNVTIQLNNVTLADALSALLKSRGCHYIVQNDILLVKLFEEDVNGELSNKIFKLKYLDGLDLKNTLLPLLSPKGKMEALLSEKEKEEINRRSNILVVTDVWENLQAIENTIQVMDQEPVQFQIEVKLVETLLGGEKQVGFNWPKRISTTATGAESTAPVSKSTSSQQEQRYFSAWYQIPQMGDEVTWGVLTLDELQASLELLAKDNNSRLVSNPKITALNDRKAIIQVGTTVPIPQVSRGIGGDLISYREKDVSMYLEVIPRMNENNIISLSVHPVLEEIVGYTGPSDMLQPITSKREVKTDVTVREGQSIVIGGLFKENNNKITEKIWLLGDIPLLGYFFKHTTTRKEKTDLLIFITPKVVDKNEIVGEN